LALSSLHSFLMVFCWWFLHLSALSSLPWAHFTSLGEGNHHSDPN
jgi:hypothetical protein